MPLEKSLLIVILLPDEYVLSRDKFYATFFVTTWNFRMSLKKSRCSKTLLENYLDRDKTTSGVIHHGLVAFSDPVETLEQRWPDGIIICWSPTHGLRYFKRFFKPLSVSNIPPRSTFFFPCRRPPPLFALLRYQLLQFNHRHSATVENYSLGSTIRSISHRSTCTRFRTCSQIKFWLIAPWHWPFLY